MLWYVLISYFNKYYFVFNVAFFLQETKLLCTYEKNRTYGRRIFFGYPLFEFIETALSADFTTWCFEIPDQIEFL